MGGEKTPHPSLLKLVSVSRPNRERLRDVWVLSGSPRKNFPFRLVRVFLDCEGRSLPRAAGLSRSDRADVSCVDGAESCRFVFGPAMHTWLDGLTDIS